MARKALFLDLDNTIYPVPPYGEEMFSAFFQLVADSGEQDDNMEDIRKDIMRRGFLLVAKAYNFSKELTDKGNEWFKELRYTGNLAPFDDFKLLKDMPYDKFLVTAGYQNFQQDKIDSLSLQNDFKEIHIIDATKTSMTKKDVFADIIDRHKYNLSEVLVIGDDLDSEIQAGKDLGIDVVLFDKLGFNRGTVPVPRIHGFKQIANFL